MKIILIIMQILLSLGLTALIFLQSGGDDDGKSNIMSSVNFEKRGWEKFVFNLTVTVMVLFFISSVIQTII